MSSSYTVTFVQFLKNIPVQQALHLFVRIPHNLVRAILILSLHTSNPIKCIYVHQLFSSELHGSSWSRTVFEETGVFYVEFIVDFKIMTLLDYLTCTDVKKN